jgi:hypothetical protein
VLKTWRTLIRVAKKEIEALSSAAEYFEQEGMPLFLPLRSLLQKLDSKAKHVEDDKGLSAAKIENTLVMYSGGKVVPIVGARDIFWIKQYSAWKALAPTVEQLETVARWLGKQQWLSPMTFDQVGYKWPSYLGRASAEKPVQPSSSRKEFTGE